MQHLGSAGIMARRSLESQSRHRAHPLSDRLRGAAARMLASPAAAALLWFTIATLARNRRHLLIVISYAGVALAIGSGGIVAEALRPSGAFAAPAAHLLSPALVLMFLLVYGVRAACLPPAEPDANWPFRLMPPSVMQARAAMRGALGIVAVTPVVALAALAGLVAGWRAADVLWLALFNVLAGFLLVECALVGWNRIPFACAHVPRPETLRSRWLVYGVPFLLFSFAGAALQLAALRSMTVTLLCVAGTGTAGVVLYRWSERQPQATVCRSMRRPATTCRS